MTVSSCSNFPQLQKSPGDIGKEYSSAAHGLFSSLKKFQESVGDLIPELLVGNSFWESCEKPKPKPGWKILQPFFLQPQETQGILVLIDIFVRLDSMTILLWSKQYGDLLWRFELTHTPSLMKWWQYLQDNPLFLPVPMAPFALLKVQKDLRGGGFSLFYFHPYLGKNTKLTNILQMGWNHQLDDVTWVNLCNSHGKSMAIFYEQTEKRTLNSFPHRNAFFGIQFATCTICSFSNSTCSHGDLAMWHYTGDGFSYATITTSDGSKTFEWC